MDCGQAIVMSIQSPGVPQDAGLKETLASKSLCGILSLPESGFAERGRIERKTMNHR